MKETEFEKALYDSLEQMKEEFKVVKNTLDIEQEVNKSNHESIKKLKDQVQSLQKDLELERPRYGGDPTRKLARDAFNQSTTEANWASLENHPVIKNLYEAIKDSRKDLGRSIEYNATRIDKAQPANEVFAALRTQKVILEINQALQQRHSDIESLRNEVSIDRKNANNQDHKLIDRIADIQTAQNALEFIQSEKILTYDAAFIFLMGAWAKSGFEPVAEGLRIMLKKPKEGTKKDGKTQG